MPLKESYIELATTNTALHNENSFLRFSMFANCKRSTRSYLEYPNIGIVDINFSRVRFSCAPETQLELSLPVQCSLAKIELYICCLWESKLNAQHTCHSCLERTGMICMYFLF